MEVLVMLDWSAQRELRVERDGHEVRVHAHPSLSRHQVARACTDLEDLAGPVLNAWQQAVGINPATRSIRDRTTPAR